MNRLTQRPLPALAALVLAACATVVAGCATATATVDDARMGLRKAGVFDTVTPVPFAFDDSGAARREPAPLPGSGMPPMIAHAIDDSLPIRAGRNDCLECHDKPAAIGKPVAAGKARPAPASHYRPGPERTLVLAGTVFVCTACHAPQAGVPLLVRSDAAP